MQVASQKGENLFGGGGTMSLKTKQAAALIPFVLILFQNCGQMDSGGFQQNFGSNTALSPDPAPSATPDPAPGATPTPAPGSTPTPVPTPAVGSDFVCTHESNGSVCSSRDTRIVFDRMEKYVRANNPNLINARRPWISCGPIALVARPLIPGYPVQWACGDIFDNAFSMEIDSFWFMGERAEALVRPTAGFRSSKHFNAPFRCHGGDVIDTGFAFERTTTTCYFDQGQASGESLADANAEGQERRRSGFIRVVGGQRTTHDLLFQATCTVRTILIGRPKNTPITVLECVYSNPVDLNLGAGGG